MKYFNDEWNNFPKDKDSSKKFQFWDYDGNNYKRISPHMFHMINTELNKPIKNNKPDGRRYKK
jgi:hypothetical protein